MRRTLPKLVLCFGRSPVVATLVLGLLSGPHAAAQTPPQTTPSAADVEADKGNDPEADQAASAAAAEGGAQQPEAAKAAPTGAERRRRRRAGRQGMSWDEALEEGFAPRPDGENAGSLKCGLLATGPGLLVHGVGHWCNGDRRSATTLFLAELTGIILYATAELLAASTHSAGEVGGVRNTLRHYGAFLFMSSYAADILGTFKGAAPFDNDGTYRDGNTFGLAYRNVDDALTPGKHRLRMRFDASWEHFYVRPTLDFDVGLDRWEVVLDTGVPIVRGDDPRSFWALGVRTERDSYPSFGAAVNGLQAYTQLKVDVGWAIPSLRRFYLLHRSGWGIEQYQFSATEDQTPGFFAESQVTEPYLFAESGFEFNTGYSTRLHVLWLQNPTLDVEPISPAIGMFQLGLVYALKLDLDLEFHARSGKTLELWLGLGYGL